MTLNPSSRYESHEREDPLPREYVVRERGGSVVAAFTERKDAEDYLRKYMREWRGEVSPYGPYGLGKKYISIDPVELDPPVREEGAGELPLSREDIKEMITRTWDQDKEVMDYLG